MPNHRRTQLRLAALEDHFMVRTRLLTFDEAYAQAMTGRARRSHLKIIREAAEPLSRRALLVMARRHQLARQWSSMLNGYGPFFLGSQILAAPTAADAPTLAREYLGIYSGPKPMPPLKPTEYHITRTNFDWIRGVVVAGILNDYEDELREELFSNPPNIDWWPNRWNSTYVSGEPKPLHYRDPCPEDPDVPEWLQTPDITGQTGPF
jgi:hypothetical protein